MKANVETIAPPGAGAAEMQGALERLSERGVGLAATFIDGAFTSDGIHFPPPEELAAIERELTL